MRRRTRSKKGARFSKDDLFQGSIHAIEHAETLLLDSLILFHKNRFSSAAILAFFGREELGRAAIYVEQPEGISADSLKRLCADHEIKIHKGSTVIGIPPERLLPEYLELLKNPDADWKSREYQEIARANLEFLSDKLERIKRTESKRLYTLKLSACYVDAQPDGKWNLPSQFNKDTTQTLLGLVLCDLFSFCRWIVYNLENERKFRNCKSGLSLYKAMMMQVSLYDLEQFRHLLDYLGLAEESIRE